MGSDFTHQISQVSKLCHVFCLHNTSSKHNNIPCIMSLKMTQECIQSMLLDFWMIEISAMSRLKFIYSYLILDVSRPPLIKPSSRDLDS